MSKLRRTAVACKVTPPLGKAYPRNRLPGAQPPTMHIVVPSLYPSAYHGGCSGRAHSNLGVTGQGWDGSFVPPRRFPHGRHCSRSLVLVEGGDLRRSQAWHHPSGTILLIATLAVICGTDNWTAVESFGRQKRDGTFPGCRTAFPHRTPSDVSSVCWTLHSRGLLRHLGADAWMLPWSRPQRSQALCIAATLPRSAGATGLTLVMSRSTQYQCPPSVCSPFQD